MKKIQLAAFLVLTGAGFYQPTAHAFVANPTDLFIGFQSVGGNGAASAYVIDIGPESLYTTGNGSTFNLNTAFYGGPTSLSNNLNTLFASDVSAGDGTYWGDTQDTYWGVGGATANGSNTVYLGKPESPVGTRTTAITAQNAGQLAIINGDLTNALNAFNSIATVNSGTQAQIQPTSTTNGWVTYNANGAGASFVAGNQGQLFVPTSGTVLDLYQNSTGSAGVYEGKFTINSSGLITYSTATIAPEPSALAALVGGAGLLGLMRRRRAVVA